MTSESLAAACRATLDAWRPADDDQEQLRRAYGEFLDTHPDGWRRECPGAHLTASALICSGSGNRVLLTLHGRIGRWLQTGGHIEAGDADLVAAARREAVEESGIDGLFVDPEPLRLDRHEVPCGPGAPTFHFDVQFLAVAPDGAVPVVGDESRDVAWFDVAGVPTEDLSVVNLVKAARRRLGAHR